MVDRYAQDFEFEPSAIIKRDDGPWVKYKDYVVLESENNLLLGYPESYVRQLKERIEGHIEEAESLNVRISGLEATLKARDAECKCEHYEALNGCIKELQEVKHRNRGLVEALKDIAGSGPVDSDGNSNADAGWAWCYDRAKQALKEAEDANP